MRLWHGGVPFLRPGGLLEGGHTRHLHPDCPICQARAAGDSPELDPLSGRPDLLYVTTSRAYARHYASLWGRGDLYRVEPIDEPVRSSEDTIETWTCRQARVVACVERAVQLTMTQRRALWREWGAADQAAARGRPADSSVVSPVVVSHT